jgi:uncharacterized protein
MPPDPTNCTAKVPRHARSFVVRLSAAALLLSVSLACQVAANPLLDGDEAFIRQDFDEALQLWRPLAEAGDAQAQVLIGMMYVRGNGVPQDYGIAYVWYRRAADQGWVDAQRQLAFMYSEGLGVPKDWVMSAHWYRVAAEAGDPQAQYNLAAMYNNGEGVPKDDVQAYMWFNLAGAAGDTSASQARERVARRMTQAQIAEAQRRSREWRPLRR